MPQLIARDVERSSSPGTVHSVQREGRGSSIPHVSALDGARGAAVAGVLLFHGGHLAGGYLGADFYFTLSGFLITSLLLAEATRDRSVGLTQIRGDALATLGYGANWRSVFSHQSYFALFTAPSPLQHTWSLAIEEQFFGGTRTQRSRPAARAAT